MIGVYPMTENHSADLSPLFSREQSENAFASALNLFVGRGRRYTSKQVERATGISHRRIDCFRSYRSGHPDHRPLDMGAMLSLMSFLGPEFTSEWLAPVGQVAFHKPDGLDYDDIEDEARSFLEAKGKAHHVDSPAGRELSPCEREELRNRAIRLRAVA